MEKGTNQQRIVQPEASDNDKLFKMTLDTFFFNKRIIQHKESSNKIDKHFANILYETVHQIEQFLTNAVIEEADEETCNVFDIIPSIESSVLQVHNYYYCKACNQSVRSSKTSLHEHFISNKHLKNLRILSKNLDKKTTEPKKDQIQSIDKAHDGSTHSLNDIDEQEPKKPTKKERLNSLPARVRDILPKDNMPRKFREFLINVDLDGFALDLLREAELIQKSQKHVRVCELLRRRLITRYQNVKVYPFGSFVNGLGHEYTDLDIFIDTENCFYGKLPKRKMKEAIFQTQRILSNRPGQWVNFQPIVKARTPILRVFCELEKIECDLSFSNGLSTANTALISYMVNLQPVSKKIILFLKFWAMRLNLGTNSYLLTLMVIFYLQHECVLPSVKLLQDHIKPIYIDTWNTAFARPNLAQLKTQLVTDYRRYLIGFFKFYGHDFDYANYIICILTGSRVLKHIFDHGKERFLPPVFKAFANYMSMINLSEADEIEDLFANYKPLVVQDPFDLVHNVGKGINEPKLMKFIHNMRCTYELLSNAKN